MRSSAKFMQFGKPLGVALAVIAALLGALTFWMDSLVELTVLEHAEESAERWRADFVSSVPDIDALVVSGRPTDEQTRFIHATVLGSDIFRFKIFNDDGYLMFVSDEDVFRKEGGANLNATARAVGMSGIADVSVHDGSEKQNRPDWYVEAYIPINGVDAATIGTFEVYVDVSSLASALRSRFNWISFFLLLGSATVYLIPSIALIYRNDQLRERDRQLKSLSQIEPLTGLMNRGAFVEKSEEIFAQRIETGHSVGVFFIDVDKFKQVNDNLGHEFGDRLLKHIASLLKETCRTGDLVARIGGDEFVVMLPDIDACGMERVTAQLMAAVRSPLFSSAHSVTPSLSVGAHLSPPGESEGQALHCADVAVYRAKSDGRGRVVTYTEALELQEVRRRRIETLIAEGLAHQRFFLEFQPIFDKHQTVRGFEALLRLCDADGNRISPEEFIPVAESAGFIEEIGRRTLRRAIEIAASWPETVFVAVNLSAHEFRSGLLPTYLESLLEISGIAPKRICLELTESIILNEDDAITDQLIRLKGLGVDIAIDDFGTGYSSLGYLWKYEFDRLKIDKIFLEGSEIDDARYSNIIETIVLLGHHLQMSVTVEGVETQKQLDKMRSLGCDLFQGFLMSRPVSLEDAEMLMRSAEDARKGGI